MDDLLGALAAQHAELDGRLDGLDGAGWAAPTPGCPGWTVREVGLHLAQTDEMALGSLTGTYAEVLAGLTEGLAPTPSLDAGVDAMVGRDAALAPDAILQRWRGGTAALRAAFAAVDPHERVQWVVGTLSAHTLASTRLSETWIHTTDVAGALGVALAPSDRLWFIARLAWRTLPYAFGSAGRELAGPVAFHLTAPSGGRWAFDPDGSPATTISGLAAELCAVAGRRREPATTGLVADGPDGAAVLELVRTYA